MSSLKFFNFLLKYHLITMDTVVFFPSHLFRL